MTLGLTMAALAPAGVVGTESISEGFDAVLGHRWPERPLRIIAADLDTGERIVFGPGPGTGAGVERPGVAIAASCAVPSYFTPVRAAGRRCVDGGVLSPSHVDVVSTDAGRPYGSAVAVVPMGLAGAPGRTGLDLPGRWANARQARTRLRRLEAMGTATAFLAPTRAELAVMGYDAFASTDLPTIVDLARAATARHVAVDAGLRSLVAGRPPQAAPSRSIVGTGTGGSRPT